MKKSKTGGVLILDFGSQYTQLIARRLRENKVYSEILPSETSLNSILSKNFRQLFFLEVKRVF